MANERLIFMATATLMAMVPGAAIAHGNESHTGTAGDVGPRNWGELWTAWEWHPLVVIPLAVSLVWHCTVLLRLWRNAGPGHGVTFVDAVCFAGGWLALVAALVSPLHKWGGMLFSVHMTQHEILMLVAAPLLVLSRPLVPFLKALPIAFTRRLVRWSKMRAWCGFWGFLTRPFVAWTVGAVVLWIWHIPVLFEAAMRSDVVHAFQHLGFVLSAMLLWWSVVHGPQRAAGYGVAVLYMFTTALHSGLLSALITFAARPWYPTYEGRTASWGLTSLEDQQLGGLIMWIPACSLYVFAGLALFAAWMRSSEERVMRWEARLGLPQQGSTESASTMAEVPPT